jgi:exopolyphosphatase / guanosine-5'-triphosphate,3'-diphosphate pyrophosphatase
MAPATGAAVAESLPTASAQRIGPTGSPERRGGAPVIAASADVGSHSVHLFVAVVGEHRLEPLLDESAFLGLGGAVDQRGRLGRLKRAELAATLARFAGVARDLDATTTTFVATEPLRRADDRRLAVRDAERVGMVPLYVLSHEEEGYLTLLGVTLGRAPAADLVVVDVGGGSSEFVVVGPDRAAVASGIRVGSSRLTTAFVHHDPPTAEEVRAMRDSARDRLAVAPDASPRKLVAVGGTATNLLKVVPAAALDRGLTRPRLARAMAILTAEPAAYVAIHHAINPLRARVLAAGVAILEALLDRYGLDRLHVVDTGVREGAVLAATRGGPDWRTDLEALARGWRH